MTKRVLILLFVLALVLVGFGCGRQNNFTELDQGSRQKLVDLLLTAANGGRAQYLVSVDGGITADYFGDATGTVDSSLAGANVLSVSFLDGNYVEVDRVEVDSEGRWGPITLVSEPRVLLVLQESALKGYYIPQPRFAGILSAGSSYEDFLTDPKDTGLVALALIYSEKYQEAANLLAGLQTVHPLYRGLPRAADIFGQSLTDEIDYAATAWAGYAAAVLARITDNDDIWAEAAAYGSYLEGTTLPKNAEALVAGWLLFSELAEREARYFAVAERWAPQLDGGYDPLVGQWLLLSGGKPKDYIDYDYQPKSAADRWVHYCLLAAINKLPAEPDLTLADVPGGAAVCEADGKISLAATSWMVLALQGGLGK